MRDFPIFLKGDIFRVHLFQIVSTIINILLLSGLPKKLYTNFNNIQRDRCSPLKNQGCLSLKIWEMGGEIGSISRVR
jgi:hypothetical protein